MTDVKYVRDLPTGLGDRIGAYMCLAALGHLKEIRIHVSWFQDAASRHLEHEQFSSDFEAIRKYVIFPQSLVFHTLDELQQLDQPVLRWDQGVLPPINGYDCIPTLAWKTFQEKLDGDLYQRAYDEVSRQFSVSCQQGGSQGKSPPFERPCAIIHVRGNEKRKPIPLVWTTTVEIVKQIFQARQGKIRTWIVMTDDADSAPLSHFSFLSNPRLMSPERSLQATLRDMHILMHSDLIIQHSYPGWSAFSHVPALLRKIPIINTFPSVQNSLLEDFRSKDGLPKNFFTFSETEDLLKSF